MWGKSKWCIALLAIGSALMVAACTSNSTLVSSSTACTAQVIPDVTVDISVTGPVDDRSLNVAELSAKDSLDKKVPALRDYKETLGATSVTLDARMDGDVKATPIGNYWCASLTRAIVKVSWKTTVFMASDLVPDSCPYKAVREHEEKHVDLDREMLPEMKYAVMLAVQRAGVTPYALTNGYSAIADLKVRIQQAASDALKSFESERDERQLLIDNPGEYNRVASQCDRAAFPALPQYSSTGM